MNKKFKINVVTSSLNPFNSWMPSPTTITSTPQRNSEIVPQRRPRIEIDTSNPFEPAENPFGPPVVESNPFGIEINNPFDDNKMYVAGKVESNPFDDKKMFMQVAQSIAQSQTTNGSTPRGRNSELTPNRYSKLQYTSIKQSLCVDKNKLPEIHMRNSMLPEINEAVLPKSVLQVDQQHLPNSDKRKKQKALQIRKVMKRKTKTEGIIYMPEYLKEYYEEQEAEKQAEKEALDKKELEEKRRRDEEQKRIDEEKAKIRAQIQNESIQQCCHLRKMNKENQNLVGLKCSFLKNQKNIERKSKEIGINTIKNINFGDYKQRQYNQNEKCLICFTALKNAPNMGTIDVKNEMQIAKLPCGHVFHQQCVFNGWLGDSKKSKPNCPTCKKDLRRKSRLIKVKV